MQHSSNRTNELYSPVTRLSDRLIEITELCSLLGYDDMRSVRSWCNKKKVPLLMIGKKTYTIKNFVELHIEGMLNKFVTVNYNNADEIMNAIRNDEEIKPVLNNETIAKTEKPKKQKMSAAALRFLED